MVSDPVLVGITHGVSLLFSAGVAFTVAKWAVSDNLSIQRALGSFAVAFVAGSLAGVAASMVLYVGVGPQMQYESSRESLLIPLWGRCIALSALGAWDALRRERKKLRKLSSHQNSADVSTSSKSSAPNNAYAAALAEIEEARLDKGTWARSFAESGGDESKAKALYIKARAEAIRTASIWVDTQPTTENCNRAETVQVSRSPAGYESLPKWVPVFIAFMVIAGIVMYQELSNRQTSAANPVQAPSPTKDQFGGTLVTEPAKRSQIDEFLDGALKNAQTATWSGNPFDQFDGVDEIAARARQFPQLSDPRAWAAVLAWQQSNMQVDKSPANKALYYAVGTVLDGLKDNKGVCRPGQVEIVSAAQASTSFPAGTQLTLLECDR